MVSRITNLSVVRKLVLVVLLTIGIVFTVLTGFLYQRTSTGIVEQAEEGLVQQLGLITATFEVFDQNITKATDSLSNVFVAMFPSGLELDEGETTRIGKYDSPLIRHAGEVINRNFAKPDEFTRITGGNATVFVRYGEDFLRVSTSLKKQSGERATGTLLGKGHPGYQTLIKGSPYMGKARLFGRDYMTKYQPVKAADGKVIAILYVGFDFTEVLAGLKGQMSEIKVGDSGLAFLADGAPGENHGNLIVHRNKPGENLFAETDADGEAVFRDAFERSEGVLHFEIPDEAGETEAHIVVFKRIDSWQFIIGINAVKSEITALSKRLSEEMVVLMSIGALIIVLTLYVVLRAELAPLRRVAGFLKKVGNGDLSGFLRGPQDGQRLAGIGDTRNEILLLESSVDEMVSQFRLLVSGIHDVADPLSQSASSLSGLTELTHKHLRDQQERTDQVATATTEMTASIQEVAGSVSAASDSTQQANNQAVEGRSTVSQVEQSIKMVAKNMEQATSVIANLKQESENIGAVLDVIRGIADQTNLLALNAAIEAARAGEQGRGFAVVADEVRGLAQRTQQSTQEIQVMIERLQAEANTAVDQVSSSHESSHRSVEKAISAATVLQAIEGSASEISAMIIQVASAAEEQSVVAEEINGNVVAIRDLSEDTAAQASRTAEASGGVAELAVRLKSSVGRFLL